ncbi:hypothetical protein [Arthrobacter sp. 35W]|uniref:hypothetical protein n=1 Tax=Arthrobacter sp. 35W TaxID=1132441 RepID=UPI0012DEB0D0|nr:hypothetical protein [Arthrobacter sp. 35W]
MAEYDENETVSAELAVFELGILCNCIKETLSAVEERELHPRIGGSKAEALALQERIRQVLYRMQGRE